MKSGLNSKTMRKVKGLLFIVLILCTNVIIAQRTDSTIQSIQNIPTKYINQIDKKIDKYSHRITSKTEKTLAKLSRWENKIHSLILKANPDAAIRLFGDNQNTFGALLQKIKEGQNIALNYQSQYEAYRDKLTTDLKFLQQQKENVKSQIVQPINNATNKITELNKTVDNTEAVKQFIKERKKQLLNESIRYIGNSKYLQKINKESYYYVETLRNYKEIFSDEKKLEATAKNILEKIPGFQKFTQQNSMLAQMFGNSNGGANSTGTVAPLAGLQTRTDINSLIQNQISAGGPNAQQMISDNIQAARNELNNLKNKILNSPSGTADNLPDFKPNTQKTKTFLQRIQYGTNLQTTKSNSFLPATTDIGLSVGYKPNDKSIIGIGASYKLGLGNIQNIKLTNQGLSLRSFIDWKLKKQFYLSGGYEMNYLAQHSPLGERGWQPSGLIGISKTVNIKTKIIKGTKVCLLYDVLARQHVPVSQPVVFRVGYKF